MPSIAACHSPPSPAIHTPPALFGSRVEVESSSLAHMAQCHLYITQTYRD